MTYCVGVKLEEGLILASDSRTHAGVDNYAKFCKMTVFERAGDRVLVLLSSGGLAATQAVINVLRQQAAAEPPHIWSASSMFDVANLVSDAMRAIERRDGPFLEASDLKFNASFILGGQIAGEDMRLFRLYAEGNFIEAGTDTPFLQTGEAKYGKPILDLAVTSSATLEDATKCVLVSLRLDDDQQSLGGHADRPAVLRAGQPAGDDEAPVRGRRRLLRRADAAVARRHAQGLPRVAAAAVVSLATPHAQEPQRSAMAASAFFSESTSIVLSRSQAAPP